MTLHWDRGYPLVDWCHVGETRFIDPFYEDTLEQQLRLPFNLLFQRQTTMDALCELQRQAPGLQPTGFIFHMSRCGSTLLAQTLAALAHNIVISEAGVIDGVLRSPWRDPSIQDEQRLQWFRALVSALARPRHTGERHFFIKFDSWHTVELPLIRQAFPTVPWIFLYRDPTEVLVSHCQQPGAQMVHGLLPPQSIGLAWHSFAEDTPAEYRARLLAHICSAALRNLDEMSILVNYRELPNALFNRIATHFSLDFSQTELATMQQATQFDAKNPSKVFVCDNEPKQQSASPSIQQAAAQLLTPIYQALETERLAQMI